MEYWSTSSIKSYFSSDNCKATDSNAVSGYINSRVIALGLFIYQNLNQKKIITVSQPQKWFMKSSITSKFEHIHSACLDMSYFRNFLWEFKINMYSEVNEIKAVITTHSLCAASSKLYILLLIIPQVAFDFNFYANFKIWCFNISNWTPWILKIIL